MARKHCTLEKIQGVIVRGFIDNREDMTIEDIASAIGCSVGTVSRVLRQFNGDIPRCRPTDKHPAPSFRRVDAWRPGPEILADKLRDHIAVLDRLAEYNDGLMVDPCGLTRKQYWIFRNAITKEGN